MINEKELVLSKKKIGILFGNRSIENNIYIELAPDSERGIVSIERCLEELSFDYVMIDTTLPNFIDEIKKCDVVFVYMHGEYGEDGRIQGLLDYLGIPYTGSGVLANAMGLNKVVFKHVISGLGIKTPNFIEWQNYQSCEENLNKLLKNCRPPYILKPTCGGSSIGITKHDNYTTILDFINNNKSPYEDYFIEEYIEGTMVTSGIFEVDKTLVALPLLEVNTQCEFYDEETKLNREGKSVVDFVVPARLSEVVSLKIREASTNMFRQLNYKGFARFDYIIDKNGDFFCLEVNSIPGLAENSNFTTTCKHVGIEYKEIIVNLLWNALECSC